MNYMRNTPSETPEEKASTMIKGANDSLLKNPLYVSTVLDRFKKVGPSINLANTSVTMGSETFHFNTGKRPPAGVTFTPGKPLNYVEFYCPTGGEQSLIDNTVRGMGTEALTASGAGVSYRIYTSDYIDGNQGLIDGFKELGKQMLTRLETALQQKADECTAFNDGVLKPHIEKEIAEEIARRDNRASTLKGLNPFG